MGTLLASTLIAQASEIVQDEKNILWETSQALDWLNDAQRAIVAVRPDSSTSNKPVVLAPGTKQSISGLRLMAVTRNMGDDGLTPGRAIRLVERGIKDDFEPDWHFVTASTEVKEYIYDDRTPQEFYVSPPVHATTTVQIEIVEAVDAPLIASEASVITLDDHYSPMMIEWVVYRFLSRDSEETPNLQRPAMHFQNFFTLLQAKVQPDMAINPKVRAHLK